MTEIDDLDLGSESPSEDVRTGKTILDINVVPFEPVATGSGHGRCGQTKQACKGDPGQDPA